MIALLPLVAGATFSSDQCKLMRMMRVDMRDICPAHARYTVAVKSQRAVEASYNHTINGIGPSGGINAGPAGGGSGYAGGNPAGGVDAGSGVGPDGDKPGSGSGGGGSGGGGIDSGGVGPGDGRPSDGNRPGGGGQPGSAPRPPFKPGTAIGQPGKLFDGERIRRAAQIKKTLEGLSREQKRRLISKIRKEQGGSDFNQPDDKGKAHRGRNSR